GILAAIAIPVFLNQRKKGYEASEKSDLRTVANEMETYFTDNQSYPATLSQAARVVTISTGQTVTVSQNNTIALAQTGNSGFCLTAVNSNIGTTVNWVYDSLGGGLKKGTSAACSAASLYA
ncbi:MAG: prepilin-type cleavage/methylation protein, partial [Frankiales bacterium]|nr:prepilin-type cleavage/methylation protein [Frankiales bacterium]